MTVAEKTEALKKLGFFMEPQAPSKRWIDQKFVMGGPPKCGKTCFWAADGETTWFLRLESGFNHVKTFGVDCRDFNEVEREVTRLFSAHKAGVFPWETVVVDPGTRLIDYFAEEVIRRGREKFPKSDINEIGDIGKGTGWYWLKTSIKMFLNRLEQLPCAVVLIFHVYSEEKNDDSDYKKTYKRDIIGLSEKMGGAVREWADHTLHVRTGFVGSSTARAMITRGSKVVEAGSRMNLPPKISWSDDDSSNYKAFRALFE